MFNSTILIFIISCMNYKSNMRIIYIFISIGIITSILNHGLRSLTLKYLDRFIICTNIIIMIYYIFLFESIHYQCYTLGLIFIGICCYLYSKINIISKIIKDCLHAFAHLMTVLVFYLLHISPNKLLLI
jgi:hypothetical protein